MELNSKTAQFIEKAINIHGNTYDYSKVNYIKAHSNIVIICPTHGEFEQLATNHLSGHGCKFCSNNVKYTKDIFIEKANAIHKSAYDYSKILYTNAHVPVTITCLKHGDFEQTPNNHLAGNGCYKCGVEVIKLKQRLPLDLFIKQANATHNNKFSYTKTIYINAKTPIIVTCPIHGDFETNPSHHTSKNSPTGCPYCADYGFNKNKPATLYYLEINNGEAYKIGITNRSVNERFSVKDLECVKILATKDYKIGKEAYEMEQQILNDYKEFKYVGPDLLSSGNTELFNKDIFNGNY